MSTTTPSTTPVHDRRPLRPRLILGLACLTLLVPVLAVALNLTDGSPTSLGAVAGGIQLGVAVAWVLTVWLTRAPRPLATLVLTGLTGGVLTAVVVSLIQLTFSGASGLAASPVALVSLIATTTLGGFVCGLIAWGLQTATRRP